MKNLTTDWVKQKKKPCTINRYYNLHKFNFKKPKKYLSNNEMKAEDYYKNFKIIKIW